MGFEMKSSQESSGVTDMHAEAAEEQYFVLATSLALGGGGKKWMFLFRNKEYFPSSHFLLIKSLLSL